ncbi:MAG: 3-keto-disaccharide hydrolase, partial [Flavisolibacter sp.]
AKSGSNIISDQKFTDFKLHVEFRYPPNGNSGVYLRGRYEVQIMDYAEDQPDKDVLGGVYGFIKPNEVVNTKPGEWVNYDITLVGRNVTIVVNGTTIVCNQEIPGITGGALDSREGEPGPVMLQGDHRPIEYRKVIITPAK